MEHDTRTPSPGALKLILNESQNLEAALDTFVAQLQDGAVSGPNGDLSLVRTFYASAIFGLSSDAVLRPFRLGGEAEGLLVYLSGMADDKLVRALLKALVHANPKKARKEPSETWIRQSVEGIGDLSPATDWKSVNLGVMDGGVAIFVQGVGPALVASIPGFPTTPLGSPTDEQAVKGAKEAFSTNIETQITQVRRRIKSTDLVVEDRRIGPESQIKCSIVYLSHVASPAILAQVRARLEVLETSEVQEIGRLQQWLRDHRLSPFPQVRSTDRADLTATSIVEGKIAIFLDNSSFALIVPATFMDFYRTTQDYVVTFWEASLIRWVRLISLFVSLYLPGLFVAMAMIHPGLIPTKFLRTLASSMQTVPFSPLVEVLMMWAIMEILREAALRLPKTMGSTISIVGGLVIGQAAVSAGIIGSPMIVVVALTAIATFTVPTLDMSDAWRVLLWPMIFAAYTLGLPGMALLTVAIIAHLSGLQSFGVPYLAPYAPTSALHLDDTLFWRGPVWQHFRRPANIGVLRPRLASPASPTKEVAPTKVADDRT